MVDEDLRCEKCEHFFTEKEIDECKTIYCEKLGILVCEDCDKQMKINEIEKKEQPIMKKFDNLATTLVSKWHGNKVEEVVLENQNMDELELMALVSQTIEKELQETLLSVGEGFASELMVDSFKDIDYRALIAYYKES
ncbi:hypothetical protein [Bacillus cereus group sp. BfR-BA-01317]|uniref:hypothetical protein n=1 Tax=Bacillus cereus group sp. BfR-BA-01317 TaxID=2920294 RepID=UPI001F5AF527|nr:hypothetical protein [Bacillus cereus group sp. BfR-BA-01317]